MKSSLASAGVLLVLGAAAATACRIPDIRPVPLEPPAPPPARVDAVLTRLHTADVRIEGSVAQIEVAATFFNPNPFLAEGTYFFPLEPDAVVRDFAMTVNGSEQKAELLDAERARQIYEDIVRRLRDPGLLEYVGTRMIRCRVFPIQPNAEIRVRLNYTQVASAEGGVYRLRYPLLSARPNAGTIDQVAVRVSVAAEMPVKLFYSPTHKIDAVRKDDRHVTGGFEAEKTVPESDFDVYWSLDGADLGVSVAAWRDAAKDEDGYLMVALNPKADVAPDRVQPKDMVFVFDKSGSMLGDKIAQARGALSHCLGRLRPADRFSVILFGTDVEALTDRLTPVTPEAVATARERVAAVEARGGTAVNEALAEAFRQLGAAASDRPAMVVFLTDGRPTIGITDIDEILKTALKDNAAKARLFVFGVGSDVNTDLLDRLATENRGAQTYVGEKEDIEVRVSAFYDKVSLPVLTGVTLDAPGVKLVDLYPRQIPDLFQGGQMLLFGRYRGAGAADFVIRGRAGDREQAFECRADLNGRPEYAFIAPIWAHRKVAFLLEEIRVHGKQQELVDEVTALGRQYGIMTPYTSFLVVDDQDAPAMRRVAAETPARFESMKSGGEGVAYSRIVAGAKAIENALALEPAVIGLRETEETEVRALRTAMKDRVKRIGGKVFYLASDGFYYDGLFDEKQRGDIEELEYLGEKYFELVKAHPELGPCLAAKLKLVVCAGGKVYRIGP